MEFVVADDMKPIAYFFPQGVMHGYKCMKGPMQIIYVTSGVYNIDDEIRISKSDLGIGYNWDK
jgi:dTDP-4-dehydrorhamnose 3,5-epimerase